MHKTRKIPWPAKPLHFTILSLPHNPYAVIYYAAQDTSAAVYAEFSHNINLSNLPKQGIRRTNFYAKLALDAFTCSLVNCYTSLNKVFSQMQRCQQLQSSFLFLFFRCIREKLEYVNSRTLAWLGFLGHLLHLSTFYMI